MRYVNVKSLPHHYPGGVILPGQSADLSKEEAARGLESGQLVAVAEPKKAAPAAPKESE